MNGEVKYMHYIPVVMTKRFASEIENCVFFAVRDYNQKIFIKKTNGLGGHRQFPFFHRNDKKKYYKQETEKFLKEQFDDHYTKMINIITDGNLGKKIDTTSQIYYIFLFLVKLMERNPRAVKISSEVVKNNVNDEELKIDMYKNAQKMNFPLTDENFQYHFNEIKSKLTEFELYNNWVINNTDNNKIVLDAFFKNKTWNIIFNLTNIPFIISDNPFIIDNKNIAVPLTKKIYFLASTVEDNINLKFFNYYLCSDDYIINKWNGYQILHFKNYIAGGETDELL